MMWSRVIGLSKLVNWSSVLKKRVIQTCAGVVCPEPSLDSSRLESQRCCVALLSRIGIGNGRETISSRRSQGKAGWAQRFIQQKIPFHTRHKDFILYFLRSCFSFFEASYIILSLSFIDSSKSLPSKNHRISIQYFTNIQTML